MSGRNKKPRIITLDIQNMINKHMWPIWYTKTKLKTLPVTTLQADEVQALARRDVEKLNMLDAAQKMWVSKTVYAGIYTSARTKLSTALIHGEAIYIQDTQEDKTTPTQTNKKSPTKSTSAQTKDAVADDLSMEADAMEQEIILEENETSSEEKKKKKDTKKWKKKKSKDDKKWKKKEMKSKKDKKKGQKKKKK